MTQKVDVLVVVHNSKHLIASMMSGLETISIPVTVYFLDNNSRDGTADALVRSVAQLRHPAYVLRSIHNNGFARGVNLLARQGGAQFIFMLNPDAQLRPGCLETLVARASSDPQIGICEARQSPREHPKTYDPATGETSWCSGAAALVRRAAFDDVGGFDERLYFMYCEDIDLSWKLWQRGWKCIYDREAVVDHLTQDLAPGKRRTRENYFSFRNSLFLFYRFGSWSDRRVLSGFLLKRFMSRKYPLTSKILFTFALIDHIRYIPFLLQTRRGLKVRKHPWIRLSETSLSQ